MLDNKLILIVEEILDSKFSDLSKEYRSIIIRFCHVLVFLERERGLIRIVNSSETSDDLIRDASRFMKLTLDEFLPRIRNIREKENKSLEDHRFLFMVDNIEKFLKEHSNVL